MSYQELDKKIPLVDLVEANDQNVNIDNDKDFNTRIDQNSVDIAQNESDIASNASDISQNSSDIAQNTLDIAQNTADIATKAGLTDDNVFTGNNDFDNPISISDYTLPSIDGANGQVMVTNGAGLLTFQDQSGSGATTALSENRMPLGEKWNSKDIDYLEGFLAYSGDYNDDNYIICGDGDGKSGQTTTGNIPYLRDVGNLGSVVLGDFVINLDTGASTTVISIFETNNEVKLNDAIFSIDGGEGYRIVSPVISMISSGTANGVTGTDRLYDFGNSWAGDGVANDDLVRNGSTDQWSYITDDSNFGSSYVVLAGDIFQTLGHPYQIWANTTIRATGTTGSAYYKKLYDSSANFLEVPAVAVSDTVKNLDTTNTALVTSVTANIIELSVDIFTTSAENYSVLQDRGCAYILDKNLNITTKVSLPNVSLARKVRYLGEKWVIVGDDGLILTSDDGETWNDVSITTTEDFKTITYGLGTWLVAGTNGALYTSTNLTAWTQRTSASFTTESILTAVFNENQSKFFIGGESGALDVSTDGTSWSALTSGFGTGDIEGSLYIDTKYLPITPFVLICGSDSSGNPIYATADDETFTTETTTGFENTNSIRALGYVNEKIVAIGATGEIGHKETGVDGAFTIVRNISPQGAFDVIVGTEDILIPEFNNKLIYKSGIRERIEQYQLVESNFVSIDFSDSPYTITDIVEEKVILVDSTSGDVVVNLPDLSTNNFKKCKIMHSKGSNNLTVQRSGTDLITLDDLTSIELPKEGNYLNLLSSNVSDRWDIVDESISCQLILNTYAGYGSIDTNIMRFSNEVENFGNVFSENHSTGYNGNTEGLEITIQKSGKYSAIFSNRYDVVNIIFGFSLNSSQLTISITGLPDDDILCIDRVDSGTTEGNCAWEGELKKGDVIRPHTSGGVPLKSYLTISYIK